MEVIENTPKKVVLRTEMSEPLANSIRRAVSEVETLAIDEVEMFKNDSALYDEVLAHRIGLVPLKTDKGMSSKTKIDLKLSKKGPCTVYAGDLEGNADVVEPKIPLTILGEDHKLELVATARLGIGLEHAKYIPGICYYRHIQEIKSSPQIDKIIEKAKPILMKSEKKCSKWFCDIDDASLTEIEELDSQAVSDSSEMLFVVESYGNMPAKEIFDKAVNAIESDLDDFEKQIK